MVVARKRRSLFGLPSMMMNFAGEAQAPASRGAIGARQHRAKGLPLPGTERPRGGLGGPPKRKGRGWDALKVLGGTLMDLDGSMGYGHMDRAAQGIQARNAMMAEQAEQQRRQAMMQKYTDGLSPEMAQLAQLAPDQFLNAQVDQAFAAPAGPQVVADGSALVGADGSVLYDNEVAPKAPATGMIPDGQGGWIYSPEYLNGQKAIRAAGRSQTTVNNMMGPDGQTYQSIGDVPEGQPVPVDLLGGYKPDTGMFAVRSAESPGGFRMMPYEGGKVDRADENRQLRAERAGGTVVQDIGRAMEIEGQPGIAGEMAVGPVAGLSRVIPGTPAHRVHQLVESALSNIGIDQLQAMRDASPTGGALGQIPVQQQARLEQMLGSLQVQQNDEDWENNARRAVNIYLDIIHGQGQGPERFDLGFDYLGRPLGARPEGLTTEEWFNMDPEDRELFQ